jgi:hypothetical protein
MPRPRCGPFGADGGLEARPALPRPYHRGVRGGHGPGGLLPGGPRGGLSRPRAPLPVCRRVSGGGGGQPRVGAGHVLLHPLRRREHPHGTVLHLPRRHAVRRRGLLPRPSLRRGCGGGHPGVRRTAGPPGSPGRRAARLHPRRGPGNGEHAGHPPDRPGPGGAVAGRHDPPRHRRTKHWPAPWTACPTGFRAPLPEWSCGC